MFQKISNFIQTNKVTIVKQGLPFVGAVVGVLIAAVLTAEFGEEIVDSSDSPEITEE